jgi:hypothetical protein
MDQEIVDIVLKKSFFELTDVERKLVFEWCASEEEFDQMKHVFMEIELMKKNQEEATVHEDKKKSLDNLFNQKYKQQPAFWSNSMVVSLYPIDRPFQRRPLVQIAALAIILLLSYPLYQNGHNAVTEPRLSQNKHVKKNKVKEDLNTIKNEKTEVLKSPESVESSVYIASVDRQEIFENSAFEGLPVEAASMDADLSSSMVEELASAPVVSHSDGIYKGASVDGANYSTSISETPDYLELLTAAF